MIKRIVEISERAFLRLERQQLYVEREGETIRHIPVEDLGMLILEHPAIVLSHAVVVTCQQNNVAIIFCDARHLPYSITLPLFEGHKLYQKVLQMQVETKATVRNRIWQQVVRKKIACQADVLRQVGANEKPVAALIRKVKSGDKENHESQAAQRYWKLLMGKGFRRDRTADGVNAVLNYGYAIIRAMIARALVATGLNPSIGLHHHNQYNGLCLADDIMEPLRPFVDLAAHRIAGNGQTIEIDRNTKQAILSLLGQQVMFDTQKIPLMVASHHIAASVKAAYTDRTHVLRYPSFSR